MALFCNDKPAVTRGNCNNYAKTECNGASRRSEQGGPGPEDGGAKGKEEEDVPRSGGAKGATRGKMVEEMACKRGFVGKRTEPVVRRHLAAPYIFLSFFLPSSLSPSSTRRHHGSSPSRCSLPSPNVSYTFRFTFALLHRASFLFQKENDFSIHFFHSIILLKKKNFQSLIPRVLLDITIQQETTTTLPKGLMRVSPRLSNSYETRQRVQGVYKPMVVGCKWGPRYKWPAEETRKRLEKREDEKKDGAPGREGG